MSEVDTIDMQAMALLTISLKTLKENGMYTKVTGLDAEIRKMAFELGMHCIAQIHQYDPLRTFYKGGCNPFLIP